MLHSFFLQRYEEKARLQNSLESFCSFRKSPYLCHRNPKGKIVASNIELENLIDKLNEVLGE